MTGYCIGIKAQGRQELKKHLAGTKLTRGEAILGKCYDCMGGYADGKMDCLLSDCPLYNYMPYRPGNSLQGPPQPLRVTKGVNAL
jgi:hypothetical protein